MSEALRADDILEVSQAAVEKIAELIEGRGKDNLAVRVAIRGALPGGGYQTEFKFIDRGEATPQDVVQKAGKIELLFDADVAELIKGSKVEFDESRYSAGFNIEYPTKNIYPPEAEPGRKWDDPAAQKVQNVIDGHINPGVASHGGFVILKKVDEKQAFVEMGGGCQGCGLAAVTLRQGVEEAILKAVPEIEAVVDITAHEEGEDPYYSSETANAASEASTFGR